MMETFLYYAGKLLFEVCLRKYNENQRQHKEYISELLARHQEELEEKNARVTALEEENKKLVSNMANAVQENRKLKEKLQKKLQETEGRLAQLNTDVTESIEDRRRQHQLEELEGEVEEMCSKVYLSGMFNQHRER
ncbi:rab11 family-interacting protein 4-like isoform X1 [Pseudonaja textilis]|uniref:rab11 family-interacting protein 4-like isoform X1 n=1 Tax=Pseudonaja textilis TaxID=8673 RepID=UPI000EA9CA03|nr:rab11 family-interacting protein 4-like isoform X1 [Pseudonaja textilis]